MTVVTDVHGILESVDSVCIGMRRTRLWRKTFYQTFKRLDSKAFWIAYCVSGVVSYP